MNWLVVANTCDDAIGTNAASGMLNVRNADKIHEVAGVDDLDPPCAGMMDRLPKIVFAKLPADTRAQLRKGVRRLSVAAVYAGDVRIGDMKNRKRLCNAKGNGDFSHLECGYRVICEPSQRRDTGGKPREAQELAPAEGRLEIGLHVVRRLVTGRPL